LHSQKVNAKDKGRQLFYKGSRKWHSVIGKVKRKRGRTRKAVQRLPIMIKRVPSATRLATKVAKEEWEEGAKERFYWNNSRIPSYRLKLATCWVSSVHLGWMAFLMKMKSEKTMKYGNGTCRTHRPYTYARC
jgi:hypothetical protein